LALSCDGSSRFGTQVDGYQGPKQAAFLMEMPKYQLPRMKECADGLCSAPGSSWRRAGTIHLAPRTCPSLWLLLTFPKSAGGQRESQVVIAWPPGGIANVTHRVVEPIALIPRYSRSP